MAMSSSDHGFALVNARRGIRPSRDRWYLNNSRLDYAIPDQWETVAADSARGMTPERRSFQTYLECGEKLPKLLGDRLAL